MITNKAKLVDGRLQYVTQPLTVGNTIYYVVDDAIAILAGYKTVITEPYEVAEGLFRTVEYYEETPSHIIIKHRDEPMEVDNDYIKEMRKLAYRDKLSDDIDAITRHQALGNAERVLYYQQKLQVGSDEIDRLYPYNTEDENGEIT